MSIRSIRYGWWLLSLLPALAFVWPARADDPPVPAAGEPSAAAGDQPVEAPAPAAGPHSRVSALKGKLMLRGKDDEDYSYVEKNTAIRDGDSLWTDEGSTAEVELEKDSFVRLGSDTKLEIRRLPPDSDLRLWKGSIYVDVSKRLDQGLLVKTPAGDIDVDPDTVARLDIGKSDSTKVSVYEGRATAFPAKGDRVRVAKGRRLYFDPGEEAGFPRAISHDEEQDALDKFQVAQEDLYAASPLPKELKEPLVGARELNGAGKWIVVENDSYWQPAVNDNWQPYLNGDWSLLGGQWCFNPVEPWGYLTCHYGRWCYLPAAGWCWWPGYVWSPASVCWGSCGDLVTWCPLDRFNRPCSFGGQHFNRDGFDIDFRCWCSCHRKEWGIHHGGIRPLRDHREIQPGDLALAPKRGTRPILPRPPVVTRGAPSLPNTVSASLRVKAMETGTGRRTFHENSLAERVRAERRQGGPVAGVTSGGRHVDPFALEDARNRIERGQSFTAAEPGAGRRSTGSPGGNLATGRDATGGHVFTERLPSSGGSTDSSHLPGATHHPDRSFESGTHGRFATEDLIPRNPSTDTTRRTQLPGRDPLGRDAGSGGSGSRVLPGDPGRMRGHSGFDNGANRSPDPNFGRWGGTVPGGDPTGGARSGGFGRTFDPFSGRGGVDPRTLPSGPGTPGAFGRTIDPSGGRGGVDPRINPGGFGTPGGFGRGVDPGLGGGRLPDSQRGGFPGSAPSGGGPGGGGGAVGSGRSGPTAPGGGPGQPGWPQR